MKVITFLLILSYGNSFVWRVQSDVMRRDLSLKEVRRDLSLKEVRRDLSLKEVQLDLSLKEVRRDLSLNSLKVTSCIVVMVVWVLWANLENLRCVYTFCSRMRNNF